MILKITPKAAYDPENRPKAAFDPALNSESRNFFTPALG
jgi:hypothetical protein